MRISHRHKFVFLATPRTASTSMRRVLDEHSDIRSVHISKTLVEIPFYHHICASVLMRIFMDQGWNWDSYFRFCVVRNPYDRVVSLYHHQLSLIRRKCGGGVVGCVRYWQSEKPRFRDYVMHLKPSNRLTTSLQYFVCDETGLEQVDAVLRYENLSDQFAEVCARLGIPMPLEGIPKTNVSGNRRHYRTYYDDDTRAKVAETYQHEIERFGYSF
jgi:hypothetical protein